MDLFAERDLWRTPKTPLHAPKIKKAKWIQRLRIYPPIWYV